MCFYFTILFWRFSHNPPTNLWKRQMLNTQSLSEIQALLGSLDLVDVISGDQKHLKASGILNSCYKMCTQPHSYPHLTQWTFSKLILLAHCFWTSLSLFKDVWLLVWNFCKILKLFHRYYWRYINLIHKQPSQLFWEWG